MSLASATVATAPAANATTVAPELRGDSLATGVAFMMVLNIVQRGVGFVRGLLFCRFLSDAALGQFSLANSFLMLAAPLLVLGLPGSLGRYIEYYRQRGQLQAYLRKMTVITCGLTGVGILLMTWLAQPLTYWVFDDPAQYRLMMVTLATLGVVGIFNFLNELLIALRQVRALSWMQFANSMGFTVTGILLVMFWESSAEAIVIAYALSCLIAMAAVMPWYGEIRAEFTHDSGTLATRDAWAKLLPFAVWVWLTNLVTNVADFVDRFMILHVSGLDSHAGQAMVGQYHSSRVVPLLLATLGTTVAAIVLPHWSHAWETGQRQRVSSQVNLALKLITMLFTAGSLLVLALSPVLFDGLLGGKYNDGLAALPWALVGAIWFAGFVIAQNYLLCAERARLVTAACLIGVLANVTLDYVALPWGLTAIMAARAIATLLTISLVLGFSSLDGLRCTPGLVVALASPLLVLAGAPLGGTLLLGVVVIDWRTRWLFAIEEEQQMMAIAQRLWDKLTQRFLPT